MPSLLDNYPEPQGRPVTFAEPDETLSYGERLAKLGRPLDIAGAIANPLGAFAGAVVNDIATQPGAFGGLFSSAERQTRLVDNAFADDRSREEAYDRRIKAVKTATGVELENPERGGYGLTERQLRALNRDGPIDPAVYRRQQFEQQLSQAIGDHPGKSGDLQFGSIDAEAQAIAKGAEGDYDAARKATPLSTPSSLVTELGGSMWGQRRDPLAVGSLLAGPSGAAGRTVAARIFSSAFRQGLYNMGISALEQPAVQAWRAQLGLRSGIVPAAEQVGMAFLSGAIPGAALRGVHEGLTAPLRRVLTGIPEAGDLEKALAAAKSALGEIDADMAPAARATIKLGEDMDAATRATAPPQPKDIPPELHDDMTAAAQRHGEDPIGQPSPAAVAALNHIEAYHGSPHDFDAFSTEHIGAGEGAQSFGHGLYFAESKGVAKSYHEKLVAEGQVSPKAYEDMDLGPRLKEAEKEYAAANQRLANTLNAGGDAAKISEVQHELDGAHRYLEGRLKEANEKYPPGAVYKVRIHADREHFLDWDKPLSEQSQHVQDAIKSLKIESVFKDDPTGQYLNAKIGEGREDASRILREAGIPGIKYLDQGSRVDPAEITRTEEIIAAGRKRLPGLKSARDRATAEANLADEEKHLAKLKEIAANGTRNFVVFDDKLIDITHKNDKPMSPVMQEVQQRVEQAQPQTQREAKMAASEALEDIGNRGSIAATTEALSQPLFPETIRTAAVRIDGKVFEAPNHGMAADKAENALGALRLESIDSGFVTSSGRFVDRAEAAKIVGRKGELDASDLPKPPPASSKDPLDKIPLARDDGTPTLVSAQTAARAGERETKLADLIRECK